MVTRRPTGIYYYDAGRPSPRHVSRLISSRTPPCGAPCAGPTRPMANPANPRGTARRRAGQRRAPATPGRSPRRAAWQAARPTPTGRPQTAAAGPR